MPLRPWPTMTNTAPSSIVPILEMQSFADIHHPHDSFINLLYIYPQSLKYDGQKVFSKARNIVCTIQLVTSNDTNIEASKVGYHSVMKTFYEYNILDILNRLDL